MTAVQLKALAKAIIKVEVLSEMLTMKLQRTGIARKQVASEVRKVATKRKKNVGSRLKR